jgi:hypothetical protein
MRLVFLVIAGGLLAQAQDVVHVDAEVTSPDGRVLAGLRQADFRVLDNGKPQVVTGFGDAQEPLDLVLLFQMNAAMRPAVQMAVLNAHPALQKLHRGDRVCVMGFNFASWVVSHFTDDLEAVENSVAHKLLHQGFGRGARIQTGIDDAALRLQFIKRNGRRRAVLLITDNIGTRSRRDEDILRDFRHADAVLDALVIPSPGYQPWLRRAGIDAIVGETGGAALRSGDPGAAFQQAMHRVRCRYSLYYSMPAGKSHSVRVELTDDAARQNPQATIRARTSYGTAN